MATARRIAIRRSRIDRVRTKTVRSVRALGSFAQRLGDLLERNGTFALYMPGTGIATQINNRGCNRARRRSAINDYRQTVAQLIAHRFRGRTLGGATQVGGGSGERQSRQA